MTSILQSVLMIHQLINVAGDVLNLIVGFLNHHLACVNNSETARFMKTIVIRIFASKGLTIVGLGLLRCSTGRDLCQSI